MAAGSLLDMRASIVRLSMAGRDNLSELARTLAHQGNAQLSIMRSIPRWTVSPSEKTLEQCANKLNNPHGGLFELPTYASTFCGMCFESYQYVARLHARHHGLFTICAHLYRAFQVAGISISPWKDMEFAIENNFDEMSISSATSILNCAKDYGIAMGVTQKEYRARTKAVKKSESNMASIRLALPRMTELEEDGVARGKCLSKSRLHKLATTAILHNFDESCAETDSVIRMLESLTGIKPETLAEGQRTTALLCALTTFSEARQVSLHFDYGGPFLFLCRDILLGIASSNGTATYDEVQAASPTSLRDFVDDLLWNAAADEVSNNQAMHNGRDALREAARRMKTALTGKEGQAYDKAVALTQIKLTDYADTTTKSTAYARGSASSRLLQNTPDSAPTVNNSSLAIIPPEVPHIVGEKWKAPGDAPTSTPRITKLSGDRERNAGLNVPGSELSSDDSGDTKHDLTDGLETAYSAPAAISYAKPYDQNPDDFAKETAAFESIHSTKHALQSLRGAEMSPEPSLKAIPVLQDYDLLRAIDQQETPNVRDTGPLPSRRTIQAVEQTASSKADYLPHDRDELETLLVQIRLLVLVHIWLIMLVLAALWALTMVLFAAFVVEVVLLYWQ